jgi:Bacterial protein of unknown function (DUF899)
VFCAKLAAAHLETVQQRVQPGLARGEGRERSAENSESPWRLVVPYVSTYGTDFPFDFGLVLTEEQVRQIHELEEMVQDPPGWLQFWASQVSAQLKDGMRENPGYIAFTRENGTVYHTYTVTAPDPFIAPTSAFCSVGRRSSSPTSRSTTARTSTRTETSRSRNASCWRVESAKPPRYVLDAGVRRIRA